MGLSIALNFCFLEEIIFYKVYYLARNLTRVERGDDVG